MTLLLALWIGASAAVPAGPLAPALALEREGDLVGARDALMALSRRDPAAEPAHRELGRIALNLGTAADLDLAELHLELARALAPEDTEADQLVGLMEQERHRPVLAAEAFGRVVFNRPEDVEARFRLAQTLMELGKTSEAQAQLEEISHRRPAWVAPRLELARAFELCGQADRAEAELVSLHREQPASALALRRLVAFYERTGRPALAAKLAAHLNAPLRAKRLIPRSRR